MIKESISVDEVIEFMNGLLKIDAEAISQLTEAQVPCNKAMADHPTVQVRAYMLPRDTASPTGYSFGLLGILNGLFGVDERGWGNISAIFDIVCPNGCNADWTAKMVGDECGICKSKLVLGKLTEFSRLDKKDE